MASVDTKPPPDLRIKHLKDRVTMVQLLEHFGHRYRLNGNMLCPWHSEKNPSARLYADQNSLWCWVCAPGHGVDIVEFVIIELGLEAETRSHGAATLRAIDFLEETFSTSYEGTPWENRLASELTPLTRLLEGDPTRYWRMRHLGLLRGLAASSSEHRFATYADALAIMRQHLNTPIEDQIGLWNEVAQTLAVLK